jgi:acetyl esterase/lipase
MKLNILNIPYGLVTSQRFDIAGNGTNVNAVVYIHGGAYFTGNKDEYPSFLLDYADSNFFASVNYRVINHRRIILWKIS